MRIARIYKAKVAALTSERTELQGRVQHMTEEMERLRSDLKHTSSLVLGLKVEKLRFGVV